MSLTTESSQQDVIAALAAHRATLAEIAADLAIVQMQVEHIATDGPEVCDPSRGAVLPGGAAITLGWWLGTIYGVTDSSHKAWPTGPNGPTPATHVWRDNGGAWAWCPADLT